MDFSHIKTIEECEIVIQTLKNMGMTIPPELQALHQSFKAGMQSIYSHLKRVRNYSVELDSTIQTTVQELLSNSPNSSDPGLLLGKIQCGKTRTFVGIMALAFDQDIDAVVVLTKSDNGLVSQTKFRMEYEFEDFLNPRATNIPKVSVYSVDDGLEFTQHQIDNEKNIFVCHKNTSRLDQMAGIMKDYFRGKRILIVDDEADFVSHAYYQTHKQTEVGAIALKINELQDSCTYSRYLQVTATPYSLFLQPGHDVQLSNGVATTFKPRFTTLVPIHDNYIGGKHYFVKSKDVNSMYSHLYIRISDKCMDHLLAKNMNAKVYNKAGTSPTLHDLRYALMSYLVGSAVRILQEKNHGRQYQTSFFMHVSTLQADHKYEKTVIDNILSDWSQCVKNNSLNDIPGVTSDLLELFALSYEDMKESNEKGNAEREIQLAFPDEQAVMNEVIDILNTGKCIVRIVNSEVPLANLLGKDGQLRLTNPLNIFVGGFRLDRGITIDHMIGFFYGRNPQINQADTVLQHHRMYGSRTKEDMAVTRLYTTQSLYSKMEWIDEMDHQLREMFVKALPGQPEILTIQKSESGNVIPCNRSRLLISELETLSPFKRMLPIGFQTDSSSAIKNTVAQIDQMILTDQAYKKDEEPFEMNVDKAADILKLIRQTYIYSRTIDNNQGMEWDEDAMIMAMKQYARNGKVWVYRVTDREIRRVLKNGTFSDAPDSGRGDGETAKKYAVDRPFLMLLKQKGEVEKGWRNAEFYWPVLRLPQNMKTCMYCKN